MMINIAILGYGTVGSGVYDVIKGNNDIINARIGEELNIKYVLDLRDFPGNPVEDVLVHDFNTILEDPEVSIVVEVMGGLHPAYDFSKAALEAGKSVCTSNKELVAKHGAELMDIARQKNLNYLFEASVGGGIPIIRPIISSMTGDVLEEITGIINGTTNYMLSKMYFEDADYDEVLKDAQANGFAELHPEADVEGYDACRKIAILSSLASGKQVNFEEIPTEGITGITKIDMKYAHVMGKQIKLLAQSRKVGESRAACVAPFLIGQDHPLFSVNGVFNAVFVVGNMLGDAMFYGQGAGKLPTASAVVGDVVDCAKHLDRNIRILWNRDKLELVSIGSVVRKFFVRIRGTEDDVEEISKVFGNVQVVTAGITGEFGFITDSMSEDEYFKRAESFSNIIHMIRMEGN